MTNTNIFKIFRNISVEFNIFFLFLSFNSWHISSFVFVGYPMAECVDVAMEKMDNQPLLNCTMKILKCHPPDAKVPIIPEWGSFLKPVEVIDVTSETADVLQKEQTSDGDKVEDVNLANTDASKKSLKRSPIRVDSVSTDTDKEAATDKPDIKSVEPTIESSNTPVVEKPAVQPKRKITLITVDNETDTTDKKPKTVVKLNKPQLIVKWTTVQSNNINCTIGILNLKILKKRELYYCFKQFGQIKMMKFLERKTSQNNTYNTVAFVEYENVQSTQRAIEMMNCRHVADNTIIVRSQSELGDILFHKETELVEIPEVGQFSSPGEFLVDNNVVKEELLEELDDCVRLGCHICDLPSENNLEQFYAHLVDPDHVEMLNLTNAKNDALLKLLRQNAKVAILCERNKVNSNEKQNNVHCNVCQCDFVGDVELHNKLHEHKMVENLVDLSCCDSNFSTKRELEEHKLTTTHFKVMIFLSKILILFFIYIFSIKLEKDL